MIPILYSATTSYIDSSNPSLDMGKLPDAISCVVEENRNGAYELEMRYPITGANYSDIKLNRIIGAKPNYTDGTQCFRIYKISKPINGVVTVNAQHISYDLSGYVDAPFTESGVQAALARMLSRGTVFPYNNILGVPFSFSSDMSSTTTMTLKHPQSVRALMGGVEGSLIDTFGGEWHFDNWNCELLSARGANRGVTIRYGKNMTDLRQEENNAAVYTHVYPYYYNEEENVLVTLTEKAIRVTSSYEIQRTLNLDLSQEFEETPTEAELRAKTQSYISSHDLATPKVNLTVGFVELDSLSERVDLCDTVTVVFDALGVSATAKCIRTKWDVLEGRYIEAELGNARNSLAATIVGIEDKTAELEEKTAQMGANFADIAQGIAEKITGNLGGYIVLRDTNNDGEPDELLIMDTPDIATAVDIIRINNAGIAFSQDGYSGTYKTAWSIDGEFVADFIASGTLVTNLVKIAGDTNFYWDAANITIVDPNNPNNMIRLGKYDGTNYGLGFSIDGGQTWVSGFDFNGITMIKNVSSTYCKMQIDGAGITFTDAANVVYMYLGTGTVKNENGASVTGSYFRFGTFASGVTPGLLSLAAGAENSPTGAYGVTLGNGNTASGLNTVAEGRDNTASGDYSVALGYNNTAAGTRSFVAGQDNTCEATAPRGVAIGVGCTVSDSTMRAGGGVAIGAYNSATAMQSAALGGNGNTAAHPQSVCLGGMGNTTTRTAQVVMGVQAAPGQRDVLVVGNSGNIMNLDQNGNLTITGQLNQNSDQRLKDIVIGDIPDLSEIKAIRYRWKGNKPNRDDREHIGYIAQEVEEVAPYLVTEDEQEIKSLDYIGLLCAKIETLERKVAELEARGNV